MAESLWIGQGSLQQISNGVDLLGGTHGFYVRDWVPAVSDGRSPVDEVINLQVVGSSRNDLSSKIQHLEALVRDVQRYQEDPTQYKMVYLISKLDGESNHRNALILNAQVSFTEGLGTAPTTPGNVINNLQLGLTRAPFWEAGATGLFGGTAYKETSISSISCSAGLENVVVAGVTGTDPARIAAFTVNPYTGGPLTEFWFGFRSNEWGNAYELESTWECEDAASYGTGTATYSESNASGAAVARYVPTGDSDTTLAHRLTLRMGSTISKPAQQRGTFTVLLRAQCSGTRDFQVRMSEGYYGSSNWRTHSRVAVGSTNYYLYPLGTVTFPPGRYHQQQMAEAALLDGYSIKLEASVLSGGTGNLYCDCLYLVPQTEGACYVNHTNVQSGSNYYFTVWTDPDGSVYSTSREGSAYIGETPIVAPTLYGMPRGQCYMVLVGQRASSHNLQDRVAVAIKYNQRYRSLRGTDPYWP